MSIFMDSQDLVGQLRGLCLVAVIRRIGGPIKPLDLQEILGRELGDEIERFTAATAAFSGIDVEALRSAVGEVCAVDDAYLQLDNLNMQLGLLSRHPIPVFPFVGEDRALETALLRPFLDVSTGMLHSAVRLRMQTVPAGSATVFWAAALRFLERMGGSSPMARAIAVSTILDVASEVIFYNTDAPNRTDDVARARQISHVLDELAAVYDELNILLKSSPVE